MRILREISLFQRYIFAPNFRIPLIYVGYHVVWSTNKDNKFADTSNVSGYPGIIHSPASLSSAAPESLYYIFRLSQSL